MRYDLERMDGELSLVLTFTFWTPEVSRFNPGLSVKYPSRVRRYDRDAPGSTLITLPPSWLGRFSACSKLSFLP